eukprot:scaffold1640_cov111-Isochrysis_galbana.AAC.4
MPAFNCSDASRDQVPSSTGSSPDDNEEVPLVCCESSAATATSAAPAAGAALAVDAIQAGPRAISKTKHRNLKKNNTEVSKTKHRSFNYKTHATVCRPDA